MRGQDPGLAQEGLHHLSPGGRSTSEPCETSIRDTKKTMQGCKTALTLQNIRLSFWPFAFGVYRISNLVDISG